MLRDYIYREVKSRAPYEASPGGPESKITGAAQAERIRETARAGNIDNWSQW